MRRQRERNRRDKAKRRASPERECRERSRGGRDAEKG